MSQTRGYPNKGLYLSNITRPVKVDLTFTVDPSNTNGLGVSSLKSNGYVRNVFMHTSQTAGSNNGYLNPNPANGYCLVQMNNNFNTYTGMMWSFQSPTTGSAVVINSTALTIGKAYQIGVVGSVPAPTGTILAIADSAGNSAGKYFKISDAFANNYVLYNVVSGVGLAPSLSGSLTGYVAVPVAYATGATASTVATAVATALGAVNNSNSFTTSTSTATVTYTSKASSTLVLSPAPTDVSTGFTFSAVTYKALATDWQTVGLQPGLTPTIGQSFIATATGGATGSGTVLAIGNSGVGSAEVMGITNTSIANSSIATFGGSWVMLQFLAPTNSTTTTVIPAAPTALSVCSLSLNLDASGVTVDGL